MCHCNFNKNYTLERQENHILTCFQNGQNVLYLLMNQMNANPFSSLVK